MTLRPEVDDMTAASACPAHAPAGFHCDARSALKFYPQAKPGSPFANPVCFTAILQWCAMTAITLDPQPRTRPPAEDITRVAPGLQQGPLVARIRPCQMKTGDPGIRCGEKRPQQFTTGLAINRNPPTTAGAGSRRAGKPVYSGSRLETTADHCHATARTDNTDREYGGVN